MTAAQRFVKAARRAGCPKAQVRNFLAGGYVPQPKQLEFHAAARAADRPDGPTEIGFGGARGPGKSHAIMGQLALDDAQRQPGLKALFLRSVGKAARESFQDLITKVCPQYIDYYKSHAGVMEFPNGSTIVLGGYRTAGDIANYLGIEYDVIAVEETTLLLEEYYTKLRGSARTSKRDWRARVYNSTNPGSIGHAWYKRRFVAPARRGEEASTRFIFATYRHNAYLKPEYIAYLESLTGNLGKMWRAGDWDVAAGQFFTTFDEDLHVREFNAGWGWHYWLAMDYGNVHYTVVYLLGKHDGTVYVVDEHAARRWLVESHANAIKAMLQRHTVMHYSNFVAGADVFAKRDPGAATVAEQYARQGFQLEPAQMDRINGAAEVLKRLGDPTQGIPPTLVIHPRCRRLIECLPMLQIDEHRPEDVMKWDTNEEGIGGDDPYDALRYGLMEAADTGPRATVIPR
jgi:phage terminase large subunit